MISRLLPPENIVNDLAAFSRRDILLQLTAPLVSSKVVTDAEIFIDALEAREQQVTTQVENEVALPHARSLSVQRLGLTLGVASESGLHFGPDPNRPCRVFFLIAIPEFAPAAHLPLLRKLAAFSHQRGRLDNLLGCKTKKQMLKQLLAFKG